MTKKRNASFEMVISVIVLTLVTAACTQLSTTVVVDVTYNHVPSTAAVPQTPFLYLRVMLNDGTVAWSNETAPRNVAGMGDGDSFRLVVSLADSLLTDPADLYMIDAYIYNADIGRPINPTTGQDAELFTQPAESRAGLPAYDAAAYLVTGVQILPGDQKVVHLALKPNFP